MTEIQTCCSVTSAECDTSMFAAWSDQFTEFCEGRDVIPVCTPTDIPVVLPPQDIIPVFLQPPADRPTVCIQPKTYWITNNKYDNVSCRHGAVMFQSVPWPSNPAGTPDLEDKQLCPNGPRWIDILKASANNDQFTLLAQEAIVAYLNTRNGAPIPPATFEVWRTGKLNIFIIFIFSDDQAD